MFQDVTECVKNCLHCLTVKGIYTDPKINPGIIKAHYPLNLLCINFTKVDPSKAGKENTLDLTDAFTKFSQVFIPPNQKAFTIVKILVDKWFYIYGIPTHIHSDKDICNVWGGTINYYPKQTMWQCYM